MSHWYATNTCESGCCTIFYAVQVCCIELQCTTHGSLVTPNCGKLWPQLVFQTLKTVDHMVALGHFLFGRVKTQVLTHAGKECISDNFSQGFAGPCRYSTFTCLLEQTTRFLDFSVVARKKIPSTNTASLIFLTSIVVMS